MTKKDTLISFNKILTAPEDAKISIFDRGFLFGDSVYEVTLTVNKEIIFIKEHLDRLNKSANAIAMISQFSQEEIREEILKIQSILGFDRMYFRIILTRGEGEIGLDPDLATKQNLIIIGKSLSEYPTKWYDQGVEVIIADTLRNPRKAMDPNIKSGNYLNNVLAMIEAKKRNAFDAIMLNHEGNVAEGTTNNIWMVKDKIVSTPPLKAGLLEGITRAKILHFESLNYKVIEQDIAPSQILEADEAFFTSSTKEIVPIVKIDDKVIGNGKPGLITKEIHQKYKEIAYLK